MNTAQAQSLVTRFLRLMEDRDLETAESLLAAEAKITFPGGHTFTSQRQVAEAASGRYQWVKKRFDALEAFTQDDITIVYVQGTLYGVNLYDVSFSDVRFIDRFVIKDGLIIQQDVWNDLAESGVLSRQN